MKKTTAIFLTLLFASATFAQTQPVLIPQSVYLPKDSVLKNTLIASVNGFLAQTQQPNCQNTFVLPEDLLETSVLLDEIKDISGSRKFNDTNFY